MFGLRLTVELRFLALSAIEVALLKINFLVQSYWYLQSTFFQARHWISRGNSLLNPLTAEKIAEMDSMACEGTIKQLNVFCDSREQNLVLKGNPAQFRKQFSDLLSAEMKVCKSCTTW